MAKFNIEVELDWLDSETSIDEEIREEVIRGAKKYLLNNTTDEIIKKLDEALADKVKEFSDVIDNKVDEFLNTISTDNISKIKIPVKEYDWGTEVEMKPITKFIEEKFNYYVSQKRYDSEFNEARYNSDRKYSMLELDITRYLDSVLSKKVSDMVKSAQANVEKEIIGSLEQNLKENLAVDTIKRMNIPQLLENLQNNVVKLEESED